MPKGRNDRDEWLAENHPALHHTIHALDGDRKSLRWLEQNTSTLHRLCRAIAEGQAIDDSAEEADPVERGLLVEALDRPDLLERLQSHHGDIHLLIQAAKGDATAKQRLAQTQPRFLPLVELLGSWYADRLASDGESPLDEASAADVGQLVGEMHLKKREYTKAVEAFTRILEAQPTADAYEGRAHAYRGLAAEDDAQAAIMRGRNA